MNNIRLYILLAIAIPSAIYGAVIIISGWGSWVTTAKASHEQTTANAEQLDVLVEIAKKKSSKEEMLLEWCKAGDVDKAKCPPGTHPDQ